MTKRIELDKWVYKFTDPTVMKFQPKEDYFQPQQKINTSFASRIRNFFSPPSRTVKLKPNLKRKLSMSIEQKVHGKPNIKFVRRLTNEHVLIGNQDQLDVMNIGGIVNQFVDTEYLWSLNIKKAILKLSIDFKKNYLVLLAEKEVQVFLFDPKAIYEKPSKICQIKLKQDYRHIHIVREGVFTVCDGKGIEVYSIDEVKGIRLTCQKRYELPNSNIKLFQIPQPYENIVNVFFEESISATNSSFGLWSVEIQFLEKDIKVGRVLKIYDIPGYLRNFTKLQNYSKNIYLLNLGKQIYAIRRGYVLDFANVDIKSGYNQLKYMSNNKLIHVSDTKVQVYRFSINQEVHPPRILVSSTDSIQIPAMASYFQFVEAIEMLSDNFAVFYQINPNQNKLLYGQTKYAFIITHQIKMEDKIRNILPRQIEHEKIENIEEKADMAKKMGLERKEIYLRLWNNSNKSSVQDFKILLDTLDYDTIKAQIQKKLKKSSMNYRQVHLLQQGCMSMLHSNVFGTNNTKQDIKNYLISHLLIRKLELYKQITIAEKNEGKVITEDPTGKLLINIQSYNNYKTMDIKAMLFQLIHRFCNEDKNEVTKIRILIKHFKFTLRIVYQEILAEIVKVTKKKFLKLLENIPELLPFEHDKDNIELQNIALMEGIWKDITEQQWEKGLFIDTVATIDNRENLSEICANVWYKRYWLTQHDFINLNKAEIQTIQELNNSEHSFYEVIQKLFENIKQYSPLREVIDFIQDNYEKMPQHIYGKVFLYRKLFDTFKENRHISKIDEIDHFAQFLKLKDQDIFKAMFNYEKVKKGFILKEMKPLYQKLSGVQVFNQGLLNYFASPKSQISDIKYLLNRMNNEKRQFHEQNGGIYQVLVRGMQLKLKLGSDQDIPIDEVLIYIQNIPFLQQPTVQRDLQIMKLINEQSARFKKIKLNMSIFDMTKNIDNVIAALIHYEIADTKIKSVRNIEKAKEITYRIINDVQKIKKKIYSDSQYQLLTIFTYFTQILQEIQMIPIVTLLLEDQWLNNTFQIPQVMIQNLILYNYKWKLNLNPNYSESSAYLKELINLLPASNEVRQYIEGQLEIAEILSSSTYTVRYPLSNNSEYFTSRQLQNIIINSPGDHLLDIDVERLYQCAVKVQQIGSDKQLTEITLHGIYQMIILRLIQCDMLRQVVPKIKNLIEIQKQASYNFIYPSLLVSKIAIEMIQQNRNLLLKCTSFLFKDPLRLLNLLQQMMSIKATSQGYKALILNFYNEVKKQNITYSQDCPLFESLITKLLKQNPELKKNFAIMLRYSLYNLLGHKQQFSHQPQFYIMFIILINQPYILVKYFYNNRYIINIKDLRCFFSFLTKDDLFSKPKVLQFLKRLFLIIYQAVNKNRNIEDVSDQYNKIPLTQIKEGIKITNPRNQFEQKLGKSLDRLKQKVKVVSHELTRKKSIIQNQQVKLNRYKQRLQNPRTKQGIFQYPFLDSDDSPKNQDERLKRKDKHILQILEPFDQKFQRETLLKRTGKDIGLYVSMAKQKNHKLLYYSQKFSKDGIFGSLTIDRNTENKIANAFENAIMNNVRLSRNGKKIKMGKVHSQYFKPSDPLYEQQQSVKGSRSKAIEVITEEERLVIQKQQQQVIKTPVISEIGHTPEEMSFLLKIIPYNCQVDQQTVIPFQSLDFYKDSQNFVLFLKELIKIAYNREDLNLKGSLIFIKNLCHRYTKIGINKQWIQIYFRAQALQNKFKLDLPLKKIFNADGLFVDSEIVENLFHFLLPSIIANLNDTNLLKLCKVITLAFKKSQLEQQILLYYLLNLLNAYQMALYNHETSEKDLKMQIQKIKMIINKIPTKYLVQKDDQLMKVFSEEEVRKEIATLFINSFRNRYDMKSADMFAERYILKTKKMTKKSSIQNV